jgi:hypothetical protein
MVNRYSVSERDGDRTANSQPRTMRAAASRSIDRHAEIRNKRLRTLMQTGAKPD